MPPHGKKLTGAPISLEEAQRTIEIVATSKTRKEAAYKLGTSQRNLQARLVKIKTRHGLTPDDYKGPAPESEIILPDFPDEDIPVERIIDLQAERFAKRLASHEAHTWFPVKVKENLPIGLLFVGDPHIDDNGCHWPALKEHCAIARDTDGIYGINIGDTTNCWGGRLIRKYADQDTSAKTARRLAEWFLLKSGINWLAWLYGNHEHMGDGMHVLAEMAKRYGTKRVVMHDWEARFVLQFPNGRGFRINAAHDFPGNSIYNPLHANVRAALWGGDVDIIVNGHKHNWGFSQWEMSEKGITPLMIRVRGYKFLDDFARKIGKYDQMEGQSVLVVFDPHATSKAGSMVPFADIELGAKFLTFLRQEARAA